VALQNYLKYISGYLLWNKNITVLGIWSYLRFQCETNMLHYIIVFLMVFHRTPGFHKVKVIVPQASSITV
jgi:hypothetical protein